MGYLNLLIDSRTDSPETPLDENHKQALQYVLSSNEIKKYFFEEANAGETDTIKELVKLGFDINSKNDLNETALHNIIKNNAFKAYINYENKPIDIIEEMVKTLLDLGIDVNAANGNGETPLHAASLNCNQENILMLIKAGAQTNLKNKFGKTYIDYLIETKNCSSSRKELIIQEINALLHQSDESIILN